MFKLFWQFFSLFTLSWILTSCTQKEPLGNIVQVRPLINYHKVKEGESLQMIAKYYHMTTEELCRLNGFDPHILLVPGQKIFIIPQKNFISKNSSSIISIETNTPNNLEAFENQSNEPSDFNTTNETDPSNSFTQSPNETLEYPPQPTVAEKKQPLLWPVKGKLLRRFKQELPNKSTSEGINISAPAGASVVACADGIIMDAGELVLGFGKMILIKHTDETDLISIYGHLQEILVQRPQPGEQIPVKRGQVIGRVGNTGNVRAPQLHFQLRNKKKLPVDPLQYLPKEQ